MKDVLQFMESSPILTVLILAIIVGGLCEIAGLGFRK